MVFSLSPWKVARISPLGSRLAATISLSPIVSLSSLTSCWPVLCLWVIDSFTGAIITSLVLLEGTGLTRSTPRVVLRVGVEVAFLATSAKVRGPLDSLGFSIIP